MTAAEEIVVTGEQVNVPHARERGSYDRDMTSSAVLEFADRWYEQVEAAGRGVVATERSDESVADLIGRLMREIASAPPMERFPTADPYLVQSLLYSILACASALSLSDDVEQTRLIGLHLERLRQALRDLRDESPVAESQMTKQVVAWLSEEFDDISRARLAGLLDVVPSTLRKWIDQDDRAEPRGDDAYRVRAIAQLLVHLRHSFTGPGVLIWLEKEHPDLDGKRPLDYLSHPAELERIRGLATRTRSTVAT